MISFEYNWVTENWKKKTLLLKVADKKCDVRLNDVWLFDFKVFKRKK